MNPRAIAFYDFDDTFFKRDSMFYLIVYTLRKKPWLFYYIFMIAGTALLYALHMVSFLSLKRWIIFPLKYLTDEELKDFYQTMIVPRYYPEVMATYKEHRDSGKEIWLVSASPEAYLKMTDLTFDVIIGTQTLPHTNVITSKNCKGEEKVRRIQEILDQRQIAIDYEASYGYSDSYSDTPMLLLVKNRFKVNKKNGLLEDFKVES